MKGIFSEIHMCVYLSTKFQVSSIILTSFRQGGDFTPLPLTAKLTPKKPIQIRVKLKYTTNWFKVLKCVLNQYIGPGNDCIYPKWDGSMINKINKPSDSLGLGF